jgi:hypothetical protein
MRIPLNSGALGSVIQATSCQNANLRRGNGGTKKNMLKPHRVPNLKSYHVEKILIVNPFHALFRF